MHAVLFIIYFIQCGSLQGSPFINNVKHNNNKLSSLRTESLRALKHRHRHRTDTAPTTVSTPFPLFYVFYLCFTVFYPFTAVYWCPAPHVHTAQCPYPVHTPVHTPVYTRTPHTGILGLTYRTQCYTVRHRSGAHF